MRNLIVVLGDQLDDQSSAWDGLDRDQDVVWMAEVSAEAQHVWSHKARIAVFLAAMRHFAQRVRKRRVPLHYRTLDDPDNRGDFAGELQAAIRRLMVTGLFALLLGVRPRDVHQWYLAVYVDAVEWVELPNTLGMSQFADGGVMASKPYAATGKYIDRMSNYCRGCRFRPELATGDQACPFTTLYWDFLMRHEPVLAANQRMSLQVKNLDRKSAAERNAIRLQAAQLKDRFGKEEPTQSRGSLRDPTY